MRTAALGLVPLTFLLFACGDDGDAAPTTMPAAVADAEEPSPAAPAGNGPAGGGSGVIVTDDGEYSFAATTCVQHDDEIEVDGAGTAPDGTPVFVSMSAGEGYANLRINLGVDDPYASSDDMDGFLISGDLQLDVSGSVITGSASLRDGSGGPDSVDVTFDVDCG